MPETTRKPWMKQPGELVDSRGIPIYPGDLLRSYHFTDRKGRKYYLYHTAVYRDGAMVMVPTCHLEPTRIKGGGSCLMSDEIAATIKVISGYGPGDCLDHIDRPRRKVAARKFADHPTGASREA